MTHVMVDLETLGLRPGAVILSIGACVIDEERMHDKEHQFEQNITRESQPESLGFHVLQGTVDWWAEQSEEAQNALLDNQVSIQDAIEKFHAWAERYPEPRFFWCAGPHFDYALYAEACRLCDIKPLFEFWAVRDVRTAKDMACMRKEDVKLAVPPHVREKLVDHRALSDCIRQTYEVCAARKRIAVGVMDDESKSKKRARTEADQPSPYTPPDLAKLVDVLIPAYLKHRFEYRVMRAKITPDEQLQLAELTIDIYRIYDFLYEQRTPALSVSACLLRDKNTNDMCVKVFLKISPKDSGCLIECMLQSDLDAFEHRFEKVARREIPNVCEVIGNGAVIPYILLCMLVYTEHVFAPFEKRTITRTQRAAPHAEAVRLMLNRYWDIDKTREDATGTGEDGWSKLWYPFLVRLMPPELALKFNMDRDAKLFY